MRDLHIFFLILMTSFTLSAAAIGQERDSVFENYAAYDAFVDDKIMNRDFIPLIRFLGGRDEYTVEQMKGLQARFTTVFPIDFRKKTVFRREDLGGGMAQEGRAYWIGESYIYFYALTHQRKGDFVVINFYLNSAVSKIMDKF